MEYENVNHTGLPEFGITTSTADYPKKEGQMKNATLVLNISKDQNVIITVVVPDDSPEIIKYKTTAEELLKLYGMINLVLNLTNLPKGSCIRSR